MQKKPISQTGLVLSEIGLGCMGMSEFYGTPDEAECIATLKEAVQLGVNHFDTADMYGFGDNERLLGRALKPFRERIIIASKFGLVRDRANSLVREVNGRAEYVKLACEQSLQRLNLDYIDLYYLHRVDPRTPIEETIGAMAKLVEEGKIKYIGLSEATADIIRLAHKVHPISAIQSEYSLWTRAPEAEILPLCEELDIGFIAYSPLGRGFLTGKLKNLDVLEANDFRRNLPRFQKGNFQNNLLIIDTLEKMAVEKQRSVAQIALSWVVSQSERIVAIPGTKHRMYLKENVEALGVKLSQKEINTLNYLVPPSAVYGRRDAEEIMKIFNMDE